MISVWFIRNGRAQFLTVGGLSSRAVLTGWTARATAEPFRSYQEAADFIRWLGLSDARPIDYHDFPEIPPDADATPVRTLEQVLAEADAEEAKRFVIRKSWTIKTAAAGAVLLLVLTGTHPSPAAAAPRHHHHHHRSRHAGPGAVHFRHGNHVARTDRGSVGVEENPIARAFSAITGALSGGAAAAVSVAQRYVGTNPTGHASLWCADFVNFIEHKLGRPGTGSREAKSFLRYGQRVSTPAPGDIVVYNRRGGGHVGYYMSGPASHPVTVSGNAGGNKVRVGVAPLPVIAIVRP